MFRFTIRDVLWLMVVVAISVLLWRERLSIRNERALLIQQVAEERASLKDQISAEQSSIDIRRRNLEQEIDYRVKMAVRQPSTDNRP
jgi:hypothetical protein